MKTTDKRALAEDLQKAGALFREQGILPSAKELTLTSASLNRLRGIVREAELGRDQDYDVKDGNGMIFTLKAKTPAKIHLPARAGEDEAKTKVFEIRQGDKLGHTRIRTTEHFPTAVIDELIRMRESGAAQTQMHAYMSDFYADTYHDRIPTWYDVTHNRRHHPETADKNAFMIFVGSDLPMSGAGITGKIIPEALEWYRQNRPELKYAVVYTRMANMRKALDRKFDMYSDGYPAATAEEAQQYLERNTRGEQPDWSIDFHRRLMQRHGGTLLMAVPGVGREDHDSLYAGVLGAYYLQNPKKQFI